MSGNLHDGETGAVAVEIDFFANDEDLPLVKKRPFDL